MGLEFKEKNVTFSRATGKDIDSALVEWRRLFLRVWLMRHQDLEPDAVFPKAQPTLWFWKDVDWKARLQVPVNGVKKEGDLS